MKRIHLLFIIILLTGLFNCSKDKNENPQANGPLTTQDGDTLMMDILNEIAGSENGFLDIQPIPVYEELYDYAETDTGLHIILDAISDFNDLIEHPGVLLGSSKKSAQSDNWENKGCESGGSVSVCLWELHGNGYIYRVEDSYEGITGSKVMTTYISGTRDGIFYGELGKVFYTISEWTTMFDDLQIGINIYFPPYREEVRNKVEFSYSYIAGDSRTIYTPWSGKKIITNSMYLNAIYVYDEIYGYHESLISAVQWNGSKLQTNNSAWCIAYEEARPSYSSTYDFENHEGAWCSFDCDGTPFGCGSY
jgi:hypothetical protein